jgi:hypothetical protein
LVFSCDKDVDKPTPNEIKDFQPRNFRISFGPLEKISFQLTDSFPFSNSYQLSLGKPQNGNLLKGDGPGEYVYQSGHISVESDLVEYTICQEGNCKSGNIQFRVAAKSCYMAIHGDTYVKSLKDTMLLPVLENDSSFCPGSHFSDFQSLVPGTRIFAHNSFAAVVPPPFFKGILVFKYKMSNGSQTKEAEVSVQTEPDLSYCDRHFNPVNDTILFDALGNSQTVEKTIDEVLGNDKYCPDYVNLHSFEALPPSNQVPGYGFYRSGNHLIFNIPAGVTSAIFQYRFSTISGLTKTATIWLRAN